MASTSFSVEEAIRALDKDGFFSIPDRAVGLCLAEMDQSTSQFSPSTVAGLEFYRLHVLQDTRVVSTLNSSFEWCAMGDYRRIREDQGHIFQLRRGGANADILVVQLWSANSQATYYSGSHRVSREVLSSVRAANRMWEVPRARLELAGCEARDIQFEDGGLVIMDARVAFETRHGSPVTFSFATSAQLKNWPKLIPPKTQEATQLVAALQNERVGAYYADRTED
ncbi:hypothetical protein BN1723_016300 [Verticillium longisporum]|uniref:Uncharacterized protein n=1 Tax=Verticillium longisporum TaxID=100787 RepID=A0A0G4MEK3_VERLO|nr:hypothetical protein BN1708_016136 [Verticillium longisporum]CRK44021.1 hypothetical protein BN1723_016300 [Verticillium longisporum]